MQNIKLNPEMNDYLGKLSREANNNSQVTQSKMQFLRRKLESINSKYTEGLESGKYHLNLSQSKKNDRTVEKQKMHEEISELQKELQKLEHQLSWAEREKQQLTKAKQTEDEKKAREAAELVERLRRERTEFKKKIKMVDVQNRLKEKARMDMIRMTHEEAEKQRINQKKQVLSTKIMSIHQKSLERAEKMQSFERQYVHHVKDMIQSNKRLYQRLEEQNRERLKHEEERMQRLLVENSKKDTDWSQIRKHELSYVRIAKQYVIHKDTSLENEFIEMMKHQSTRSNSQLRRLEYKPPQLSSRKINTEAAEQDNPERRQLTREERLEEGNRLLQKSLVMIDRNKPLHSQSEHNTPTPPPNYIPEVRNGMREFLDTLAKKISSQIQIEQKAKAGRDQSYNKRMLDNIRKLDGIIERKTQLENRDSRPSVPDLPQGDPTTDLLLKNIKSKLQLLQPQP